jgi:hypothetical protein
MPRYEIKPHFDPYLAVDHGKKFGIPTVAPLSLLCFELTYPDIKHPLLQSLGWPGSHKMFTLEVPGGSNIFSGFFVEDINTKDLIIIPGPYQECPFLNKPWSETARKFGIPLTESVYTHPYVDLTEERKKYPDFPDWLKNEVSNNYISHFYGQKSKQINYQAYYINDLTCQSYLSKVHILYGRGFSESLESRTFDIVSPTCFDIPAMLNTYIGKSGWDVKPSIVFAVDKNEGPIAFICAPKCKNAAFCGAMIKNVHPKYKPYQVTMMLHLRTIEMYYYNEEIERVYLGTNLDDNFNSYKRQIKCFKEERPWSYAPLKSFTREDDKWFVEL